MYKFEAKINNFEVCLTTDYNDWHILPIKLIDDIASGIRDGKWYTILGPPRCQKSFLLKSISYRLQNDKPCVIVDLKELISDQHEHLLRKFCILIRDHLNKLNLSTGTCFDGEIRDVNQVVIKFRKCLSIIKQDLVLFIDHIEKIKIRPLMLLFDVFENIYRTQKENDPYKLTLVIASSFIVPSMAQKQPPIPEFAEVILIQDLRPGANKILIDCFAEINSVEIDDDARKLCIDYASDDREVIFKLLKNAYYQSDVPIEKLPIRKRDVQKAIDWFIKYESKSYVPLKTTIRAIENSPGILLYVLPLLESLPFPIPFSGHADDPQIKVDSLLLTGSVRKKINEDGSCEYIIRNKIYQRCLKEFFDLDRIVNILKTSGHWDWAIDYLEKNSKDSPAVNAKLLETIVSSIYVAKVEGRAYGLLLKALTDVFKIAKVRIYIINTDQTNFMMVSQKGAENYPRNLSVEEQSTPEIQAYLCKDYIVDIPKDKNKDEVLIMPLLKDEDNVFGLVAMHNFKDYHLSDEFQDLLSFLIRSGEAIGTVIERQRAINRIDKQAKRLEILQGISSSLVSKLVPKEILDSIGQHICELLEADSSLFLIVDKQKGLITEKCGHNYDDEFLNQLEFDELMEGVSGEVLETGKPCRHENAQALSKGKALKHAEEHNTGPIIVTPLLAKTNIGETASLSKFHNQYDIQEKEIKQKVIGTLTACRKIGKPPFTNEDYDLARMLALQAAVGIENAKLYERVNNVREFASIVAKMTLLEDSTETLKFIVGKTREILDSDSVILYTYDSNTKKIRFPPTIVGIDNPEEVLKIGKVSKKSRPVKILSMEDIGIVKDMDSLMKGLFSYRENCKSCLAIPLEATEYDENREPIKHKVGVMFINYKTQHHFDDKELSDIRLFSRGAAIAIRNNLLYEELVNTKALVVARTAVARMGMASSIVQHSIRKKAITIKNEIELINSILQININSMLGDRLSKIDKSALNLVNLVDRSIIAPLCSDDIAGSMSINNLIHDAIQEDKYKPFVYFNVDKVNEDIQDSVTVRIHSEQFQKIFSTLLDNSIEAMHDCKNKQIDVCTNKSEGMIEITIQDFGCGIPLKIQSKLFKEQIKHSDRNKGLGIGLFLANTIAQLYGGSIEIGNTGKDGTKMILKLPYETKSI